MIDSLIFEYNELVEEKRKIEEDLSYTKQLFEDCRDFMQRKELSSDIVENKIKLGRIETRLKDINDYLGMHEIDIEEDTDYSKGTK